MEKGIEFPPIVVQKDTYTLIDGLHRLDASKELEKKKIKVEILDIPNSELRAEAVRRNIKQGERLTPDEISRSIIDLRFRDKKTLKEIAEIVDLSEGRISQICSEFQLPRLDMPELSNFNSKDIKFNGRVKVGRMEDKTTQLNISLFFLISSLSWEVLENLNRNLRGSGGNTNNSFKHRLFCQFAIRKITSSIDS